MIADRALHFDAIVARLEPRGEQEIEVLIDAMLSYRAVDAWPEMIAFIQGLPQPIAQTVMVQQAQILVTLH